MDAVEQRGTRFYARVRKLPRNLHEHVMSCDQEQQLELYTCRKLVRGRLMKELNRKLEMVIASHVPWIKIYEMSQ